MNSSDMVKLTQNLNWNMIYNSDTHTTLENFDIHVPQNRPKVIPDQNKIQGSCTYIYQFSSFRISLNLFLIFSLTLLLSSNYIIYTYT